MISVLIIVKRFCGMRFVPLVRLTGTMPTEYSIPFQFA
jgi:hypothetical protein